jgi:beta-1,4-mannosyltransferase
MRAVTILHGHYKDRFKQHRLPERVAGRLLYFGLIRPYKGVESLIETFSRMPDHNLNLRIVGKPYPAQGSMVRKACQDDPRISARLEFVDDASLVQEIGQAELVVLPYKEMHNSGALLVALSLGRPVLVPHSTANSLIAEEVGESWLLTYEDKLTEEVLRDALVKARRLAPYGTPDLKDRDWNVVGEAHYRAYLRATCA